MGEEITLLLSNIERILPNVISLLDEARHYPIPDNELYGETHIGRARANALLLHQLLRAVREIRGEERWLY
jgi:hypothetical protein